MPFQWISQEQIIWDWDLNPREKDESHVRAIASHMNEHGYDPKYSIIVYEFEGTEKVDDFYRAATGHHRLEATLLRDDEFPNLPLAEVYVEIITGTRAEYVRRMLTDNFQHVPGFNAGIGKIPSATELHSMRKGVMLFPDMFEKGDRLLAKAFGCDRSKVSHYRDMIIKEVQVADYQLPGHISEAEFAQIQQIIEKDVYLGADGKKYPRTTKPVEPAKLDYDWREKLKPVETEPEPIEATPDEELDADLKKKLTDIFTLHGSIPIYNPLTQKSYSDELAEDSDLSAAEVYLQINQFKTYIHELEKGIKKSLKQDPSWKYDSLACAMNLMQEEAGIVKTIMANIESRQQFLDRHPQGKLEKRLLSEEPPTSSIIPESAETETPVYIDTMEVVSDDDETDSPRINCINIFIEEDGKEVAFYFYADELKDDEDRPLTDIPKQIRDQLLDLVKNLEVEEDE